MQVSKAPCESVPTPQEGGISIRDPVSGTHRPALCQGLPAWPGGAPRVLLLGCRGGSPGTPWVLSAGGHSRRGSSHLPGGTERPSLLGAAQGWGCSVVQAAWAMELSSEMSTGITQPNLSAFPSPWDPHPQQPRSSSSVPSGGGQALGVDGRCWKPWICVSAAPAAPAP